MVVRRALCLMGLFVLTITLSSSTGHAGSASGPPAELQTTEPNPLISALRTAFTERNQAVTRVAVLELRSTGQGTGPYVMIGRGIRPDMKFTGRFDDELFGVFIVDSDLTKIERTLEIFPTRRWADYFVSIEKMTPTDVTIVGEGSYGDAQLRKVYSLR